GQNYSKFIVYAEKVLQFLALIFFEKNESSKLLKQTSIQFIQSGQFTEDMIPTVGFNMRKITKGNVTIKLWDIGGQPRFRSMWERYCRGVNAIVFMVDAADEDKLEVIYFFFTFLSCAWFLYDSHNKR
ncbi:hypothetical protein OSTOST_13163, partial [Ostertagia ostertagi]